MKYFYILILHVIFAVSASAQFGVQPFNFSHKQEADKIVINAEVPKDHYLYADKVKIVFSEGANNLVVVNKPAVKEHNDEFLGKIMVYEGNGISWTVQVKKPGKVTISFQGCRASGEAGGASCFPPSEYEFSVDKSGVAAVELTNTAGVDSGTAFNESVDDNRGTFLERLAKSGGIWLFVAAFLGGVLSSLTPCVLPMIPITMSILGAGKKAKKSQAVVRSLLYVLGIVVTFSVAAFIAAGAGKALGGSIFGNPYILGVIVIFLGYFGFSMLGLYEIQLPAPIMNRLGKLGGNSVGGAFLMGLGAGFIAFPCTGPFLAFLLTLVAALGNPIFGILLLATYAVGFSVLIFFIGIGAAKVKSGAFMDVVKSVLGIVILALAGYGLIITFPVIEEFIAAIGSTGKIISLILIIIGFSIGAVHIDAHTPGIKYKSIKIIAAIMVVVGLNWNISIPDGEKKVVELSYEKSLELASETGKPLFIDFTAKWCTICKEIDAKIFSDSEVQKEFKSNWIFTKVDLTKSSIATDTIKAKYGVKDPPGLVVVKPDGTFRIINDYHSVGEFLKAIRE